MGKIRGTSANKQEPLPNKRETLLVLLTSLPCQVNAAMSECTQTLNAEGMNHASGDHSYLKIQTIEEGSKRRDGEGHPTAAYKLTPSLAYLILYALAINLVTPSC